MRIGELAERAEVNIQTLRFYEREGLLPPPERTASGYRSYALSDLERVRFIRICQGLGFTLREIQQLLDLHRILSSPDNTMTLKPSAVRELLELANERMTAMDEKIKALSTMRANLQAMATTLASTSPDVCPVPR